MKGKVLIVGGSIGGLFAGVLLHRAGFDVAVYERSTQGLDGRGAGLVAQQDVFTLLREVGVERLARFGVVAHERIHLDRANHVIQRQRTPQTQISWDLLFRTFREMLPPELYVGGAHVTSVSQDGNGASIQLADGRTFEGDLVIGVDGLGSRVREAVAGRPQAPRYVGYATWRGLVPEHLVPQRAADVLFERFAFFDAVRSHVLGYLVPGSDASLEPGRRRFNWVWYRRYSDAELTQVLTDAEGTRHPFSLPPGAVSQARVRALHADAGLLLPEAFADAVQAESQPFIQAIYDYEAPRMVNGRVALLGDAAFVARPHTAMGVAKAAGDAMELRNSLVGEPTLEAALERYARARESVGAQIVAYGRQLGGMLDL
ncbi:FAD binding domain-containing protein [Xanthobacter sp. DSM 24535]|uniref:FAD binding domain-containing protein n=1 Tax=Roseixanthobacter psychrophilus TaxID=3119917 RepID=UPI003728855A